jgi:glycosyltransferase involved in cell wall biosynthesis
VPVVAADLPELARLVAEQGLGATYRPGDPASLACAVADVVARYPAAVAAVAAAQQRFGWEHDAAVLVEAYRDLPPARPPRSSAAGGGSAPAATSGAV